MIERPSKTDVLAVIEREKSDWKATVNQVGRNRMEEPGVMGEWTFKDLAAHMAVWQEHTIRKIEATAEGLPEPAPE